jgi:hypothetical protein
LKAVQGVGVASGLACILFAWLILRIYSKTDRLIQLLGTGTVAFLPMVLYIGPTISNELFSAAMMSFGLYLLAKYGFQESIRCTTALLTGIVFGLALLSKYTAFLLFLVAVAILLVRIWIRAGQRRREMAVLLIFCSAVFAVSGWFYARNAILFKKPFVANWDRESGFNLEQPPGYRTLGFYARFGSVLTHTPERSRWLSFWDGYYGSMWMDTHFNMIDYRDQKANSYGTVLLGLALLPSAAILLGFAHSLKRVFWERRFEADFALVACVAVAIPALVLHTLQVPTITVLKAFFTLLLVPALAVFSGLGLREMAENLGRLRPLLYILLLVHFLVICALFWYRP